MAGIREFVIDNVPTRASLKSALTEFAAIERGLAVRRVSRSMIFVEIVGASLPFVNMNGPHSSQLGKWLCDHKDRQRSVAEMHGLPVARSAVFPASEEPEAIAYAEGLGWPVVVKPCRLSRGRGVTAGITSADQFRRAWQVAIQASRRSNRPDEVLVEAHVSGEDFRFFVVDGRVVSVTHRKRAHVVGDGTSSVGDLVAAKNDGRADNPYLRDYPIPTDLHLLDVLVADGHDLTYVPGPAEHVVLRSQSNLSAGGDSVDLTDAVDSHYAELAVAAVQSIPGLPHAGVDIIAPSVTENPAGAEHIVSEVEYSPAPLAHFPLHGAPRDMAGAVLDHYLRGS